MLMPGLDCSPNGPVWTNFANFRQNLQQASVGLFFRYHFRRKSQESLATLNSNNNVHIAKVACFLCSHAKRHCNRNIEYILRTRDYRQKSVVALQQEMKI